MEAATGIEPVCTALQAVASPLGHTATVNLDLRADDGIRTRDPHLGKVMRYQLRYIRIRNQGLGHAVLATRTNIIGPTRKVTNRLIRPILAEVAPMLIEFRVVSVGSVGSTLRFGFARGDRVNVFRSRPKDLVTTNWSRGSVEERPVHTGKVAGSIPAGTTISSSGPFWARPANIWRVRAVAISHP